jgi:hypothetical protein
MAREEGFRIKSYHSDNGIFACPEFKQHCSSQKQKYNFGAVGAKHQNGIAERNIKTVAQWARANMLHLATLWPEYANAKYWPQAIDYAVWVFNRLPNMESGISPNEIWSSVRSPSEEISRSHVFGCPVYVLDASLQDGKKIPKWNPRARLGLFLGFSDLHSSLVPMVLNVSTGFISPQFHVIFDDKFETVHSLPLDQPLDKQWADIFKLGRECFLDIDYDESDRPLLPSLSDLIKEYNAAKELQKASAPTVSVDFEPVDISAYQPSNQPPITDLKPTPTQRTNQLINPTEIPLQDPPTDLPRNIVPGGDGYENERAQENVAPGGAAVPINNIPFAPGGAAVPINNVPVAPDRPKRNNVGTYKDGPAVIRKFPIDGEAYDFSFANVEEWEHPVPAVANRGRITDYHPNQKLERGYLAECFLLQDNWFEDPTCLAAVNSNLVLDSWEMNEYYFNDIPDPRVLEARTSKTSKYNEDNPSFDTATRGPFQAQFWQAMRLEFKTLTEDFDCWEYVPNPGKNVLPSTWAFKIKRYPDGRVKKFKARFCARGDRQQEGIDYFETWAPVVQWSTVRIVMTLAVKLNLISVQCDITAAFIHGRVPPTETIYVHQPRGFNRGNGDEVLRLKRTLYGLKQSPRYFFQYISERLIKQNLRASEFDPCLFMNESLIVIVYVDDILIYGRNEAEIDNLIERLKHEDIALHKEGTAEGYLGVDIQRDGENITLKQEGLTKRIIEALGLNSKYSTPVDTPAETGALGRDVDGKEASGTINYASVVGMLLYLGHSRPDISFATHQCARYNHSPKQSHEEALKRIGRYLKGTLQKGLILNPSHSLKIDCYPDADFAGLWTRDDKQDPHCVRSRTGYVICVSNCPVLWKSKLQSEIALSTMEAEYVALSTSCRDLFPLIDITKELCETIKVDMNTDTKMHIKIHEDNVGALTLGKLEPRRMTPRSKHYAVKYHWFREHIGPRNIQLVKISSNEQLGDLFTKGLSRVLFQGLRKKLMGW